MTPTFHRGKAVGLVRHPLPRRRCRRARHDVRRRPVFEEGSISHDPVSPRGVVDESLVDLVPPTCASRPGAGRHLFAGSATRSAAGLNDMMDEFGHRRSRPTLPAHPGKSKQAALEAIRKIKPGTYSTRCGRRRRQADRPGRHHDDRRRSASTSTSPAPRTVALRHQRAGLLHRGLCRRSA